MNESRVSSSPFAHEGSSVSVVMLHVILALIPCTLFGLYIFGWPAINLFLVTCFSALATEVLCLWAMGQPIRRLLDGSALLTGWLIAITLPPWAPWWIGVFGSFFAISIGKQLYGGIGQNIFNPAMLARTALLITFPVQMTTWVSPSPLGSESLDFISSLGITFANGVIPDGLTGATSLGELKTSVSMGASAKDILSDNYSMMNAFIGNTSGSMGETSALLVILGGLWLLWKRIISLEIPLSMLIALAVLTAITGHFHQESFAGAIFHLSTGGVMLGAFFIATDPITSPVGGLAKIIFGAGCGVLIFIIRVWGGFPEAVAFSVLFMNSLTPLIERYCRPRVYGRLPGGKPLGAMSAIELIREYRRK